MLTVSAAVAQCGLERTLPLAFRIFILLLISSGLAVGACHRTSSGNTDTGSETATDADSDGDADSEVDTGSETGSDGDTDTDTDTDGDADTDTDTEPVIPIALIWVAISGGTYSMGLDDDSAATNYPAHNVTIAGFEMLQSEVTVHQYRQCVDANVCTAPGIEGACQEYEDLQNGDQLNMWFLAKNENHPVNCLTWLQADTFCQWISARLPSESEWEYAARSNGGDIDRPWGTDDCNWNGSCICDYAIANPFEFPEKSFEAVDAVLQGNREDFTTREYGAGCFVYHPWPVCSLPAGNTSQGLCDMAGNVAEWTQDYFHFGYVGAPADGAAWELPMESGWENCRITRGGHYDIKWNFEELRTTERRCAIQTDISPSGGFRCARNL